MVILRLLIGKLFEGWKKTKDLYNGNKVSIEYHSSLPDESREAYKKIKTYFKSKGNLIDVVRNNHAFHYSPEEISENYDRIDSDHNWYLYTGDLNINSLFYVSEVFANQALVDATSKTDTKQSVEAVFGETLEISKYFTEFIGGCMFIFTTKYLLDKDGKIIFEELEPKNRLSINEIKLPFFVRG